MIYTATIELDAIRGEAERTARAQVEAENASSITALKARITEMSDASVKANAEAIRPRD